MERGGTLLLVGAAAGLIVIAVAVLWHPIHRDSLPLKAKRGDRRCTATSADGMPESAAQSAAVPKLPELRDPPSQGEVYQILRRVADAYRTITGYRTKRPSAWKIRSRAFVGTAMRTVTAAGSSRREFPGTVRVVKPDKARIEFQLDGNSSFRAHSSQAPRGRGTRPAKGIRSLVRTRRAGTAFLPRERSSG